MNHTKNHRYAVMKKNFETTKKTSTLFQNISLFVTQIQLFKNHFIQKQKIQVKDTSKCKKTITPNRDYTSNDYIEIN